MGILDDYECDGQVAPLAGAWIEIGVGRLFRQDADRRSPRGSVD